MRRHTPPCPYQHLLTLLYGRIFVYIFASLTYALAYHYLLTLIKLNLWILKEHNNFSYHWKFEHHRPEDFREIIFLKLEILQRMYGSLTFWPPSNSAVFNWRYFFQYCFKTVHIAQVNQLFQLLNSIRTKMCIRRWSLWVKSYANEEECNIWRKQSFAYLPVRKQERLVIFSREGRVKGPEYIYIYIFVVVVACLFVCLFVCFFFQTKAFSPIVVLYIWI